MCGPADSHRPGLGCLGSTIYDYTLDICDGTTLTREVMWSASKSDLRTENYVTYTPPAASPPW